MNLGTFRYSNCSCSRLKKRTADFPVDNVGEYFINIISLEKETH